jgi:hypothetical protein
VKARGEGAARSWRAASGEWHIDVRGLSPPQPMVEILRLVQQLSAEDVLIVHLDRDPVWLYPELQQLGWWAEIVPGDPGEVRLRIARET